MNDQDDLKQLFTDATANIRPHGTYDDIRTRTEKVDPMARRWFLPTIAAAAMMALVIGGAYWITQDKNDSASGPAGSPTVTTERAVPVYYVGAAAQGDRLFREFQKQQVCTDEECLLEASVTAAVAGQPEDGDYRNPWPAGVRVVSASANGDAITVDLSGGGLSAQDSSFLLGKPMSLAVQQLIYSAQAGLGQGRVPVQVLIDGERAAGPIDAAEELDVLAPVQISSPGNGETFAPGDVTVTGVAAAFEANVVWELLVGGDAVVKNGFATTAECCKHAPYEFVLEGLEPGTYTLVVHDEDMSGEGRPVNSDTKDVVVE